MDLEAPVDAWYVWIGVAVVSVAVAGLVLTLPSGPPPDANRAANTIDAVAGSPYEATGRTPHDGAEVRIEGPRISLRNDHGTTHASTAYGPVVPVMGTDRLEALAAGEPFEVAYEPELEDDHVDAGAIFLEDVEAALERNEDEWRRTDGELTVRHLGVEPQDPDPIPYANVSATVTEVDHGTTETGERGNFITGVSLEYEGNEPIEATVGVYNPGTEESPSEPVDVTLSSSERTATLDLSENGQVHAEYDNRPAELVADADDPFGERCTRPLLSDRVGATATCSFGQAGAIDPREAGDVADRLEWIELDRETRAYQVTLVDV